MVKKNKQTLNLIPIAKNRVFSKILLAVVGCFQSNCPAASELAVNQQQATQYCGACNPTTPTTTTATNGSTVAFPTLFGTVASPTSAAATNGPSASTASPSPFVVQQGGAASSSAVMGAAAAVAAGLVGVVALAL